MKNKMNKLFKMKIKPVLALVLIVFISSCSDDFDSRPRPFAQIVFPASESISESDQITVRGIAASESTISSITVNGVEASTTDGYATWQAVLPLAEGLNTLAVRASDEENDAFLTDVDFVRRQFQMSIGNDIVFDQVRNRFLVSDSGRGAIISVDSTTGQTSRFEVVDSVSSSSLSFDQSSLALDTINSRLLVMSSSNTLYEVDLTSGMANVISSSVPSTPDNENPFSSPSDIALNEAATSAFVINSLDGYLLQVDSSTGVRQRIADLGGALDGNEVRGLLLDEANNRALAYRFPDEVIAVDLGSGVQSVVSAPSTDEIVISLIIDALQDVDNNRLLMTESSGRVIAVDLTDGSRSIIVDFGASATPPLLPTIGGMAFAEDVNTALLTDGNRIISLDTQTAQAVVFASSATQSQPRLIGPESLAFDAASGRGVLLGGGIIYRQNFDTGSRIQLSNALENLSGQDSRIVIDGPNNRLLVSLDDTDERIVAFDFTTRLAEVFSSNTVPNSDVALMDVEGFALDSINNQAVVLDSVLQSVVGIDLDSGQRRVISGPGVPNADDAFVAPDGLEICTDGAAAFVIDEGLGAVLSVDLITGVRALISDSAQSLGDDTRLDFPVAGVSCDANGNRLFVSRSDGVDIAGYVVVDLVTGQRTGVPIAQANGNTLPFSDRFAYDSFCDCLHLSDTFLGVVTIDLQTLEWVVISQ